MLTPRTAKVVRVGSRHSRFRSLTALENQVSPGADRNVPAVNDASAISENSESCDTSDNEAMEIDTVAEVARSCDGETKSAASLQIDELRLQIEGKNELISALVGELEQVAEQLERAKRSGSDRSRGNGSASVLPPEVVEEHQQVLGELHHVVEQWEQLQAAQTLGRIESQICELRDLIAGNAGRTPTGAEHSQPEQPPSNSLDSILARLAAEANTEKPVEPQSPERHVESTKCDLPPEPVAPQVLDRSADELVGLLNGLAVPVPVDMETATYEELKRACVERDVYIVQITRWVRTRRSVTLPVNWDQLQEVPDEMRRQVNLLASQLGEQVRLAEVEMSLERARLSRERCQFQADVSIMEKHLKRLGITSLDELEDIAVNSSSSTDRRWMRFLGVNRKG